MAYAILCYSGVNIGKMEFLDPINWIDAGLCPHDESKLSWRSDEMVPRALVAGLLCTWHSLAESFQVGRLVAANAVGATTDPIARRLLTGHPRPLQSRAGAFARRFLAGPRRP
jgi:hypothetical protein